jgi:hypothetical protein
MALEETSRAALGRHIQYTRVDSLLYSSSSAQKARKAGGQLAREWEFRTVVFGKMVKDETAKRISVPLVIIVDLQIPRVARRR